ncbi:cytochrome c oxidase subunit II [Anabaena cylindrica FACHB-243]|uniref:Cytochrome c oxidase subunit 2 n=1 Tax=Anabaena cylindrica (strain ATCC 27899 / PCC 7122) TaxID=272123 RepID=K9ZP93_ANACC|nr:MULTISPECIES: cytochrome c oxidase subunit II [Anabaena]AFZ60145.1 cytochrome c oxidase, subunit II [Anabaena cylindrica PCC 7122]MBD2417800.1 cytochrome c oxidase subunit II [Anabaena cylindrica FACHB-243]MBY5285298.1 cytochrome c oxidase subunit II [Anabaena sp. CCAP 1446/1C]MBY5308007.1 cytochrome c oxidase subunit II [Anabaena sp. CCAP 1446/1C]MCM2404715.1 cytochrome c oxidase subunit II [Anabaena sp. CCAP 1446/1C]
MKIPSSIWTLLIGIVLTLASLWYGQNHGLLPTAASDEAILVDGLFNTMMIVSTGIFLLVEGILIYAAFKYRRRAGDNEDGPAIEGNVPLEILWTAIPAIIVLGISVYSFDVYNEIGGFDPHAVHAAPEMPMMQESMSMPGTAIAATLSDTPPSTEPNLIAQVDNVTPQQGEKPSQLVVNVSALQYAWIFTYPDTGVTTGELHIPVGQQVEMNMTANDVIHAFWVPEFRLKQDVIPGRQSEIRFTPNKVGEYTLICAELCGPYHGAMRTQVVVESQEAYDTWMQEQLVASKETLNQAVAVNPTDLSADEFLAPYTKDMGIHSEMLPFHRSSEVVGFAGVTE